MYYYCDDIINGTKTDVTSILLDKKLYDKISVYTISYKTLTGPKPLLIRFHKIDGFIVSLDGKNKQLIIFDYGLFNNICDKIKYLISKKVVLQIALIIILERSKLLHIILYLLKNIEFS